MGKGHGRSIELNMDYRGDIGVDNEQANAARARIRALFDEEKAAQSR